MILGEAGSASFAILRLARKNRPLKSAKEEVQDILDRLPDDASLEEIQYHIYVCQRVAKGEAEVRNHRTLSQADVEQRLARWLEK